MVDSIFVREIRVHCLTKDIRAKQLRLPCEAAQTDSDRDSKQSSKQAVLLAVVAHFDNVADYFQRFAADFGGFRGQIDFAFFQFFD